MALLPVPPLLIGSASAESEAFSTTGIPTPDALLAELSLHPEYYPLYLRYQVVTQMHNLLDIIVRGHAMLERAHGQTHLTPDQIDQLRSLSGAYRSAALDLRQHLPREQRLTSLEHVHQIRSYLISTHLPVYEQLFLGPQNRSAPSHLPESVGETSGHSHRVSMVDAVTWQVIDFLWILLYRVVAFFSPHTPAQTMANLLILMMGVALLVGMRIIHKDNGYAFDLNQYTATVVQERRWSETKVSGTVSGGGPTRYGGGYVQGSVGSKTTRYQEIYLQLKSGKEFAVDFIDERFPCRPGHVLTIFEVARYVGKYYTAAYYNHATESLKFRPLGIRRAVERKGGLPRIMWTIIIMALIFSTATSYEAHASLGGLVWSVSWKSFLIVLLASMLLNGAIHLRALSRVPEIRKAIMKKLNPVA